MATLITHLEEKIDIIEVQGTLDDEAVEHLRAAISTLRQQGSAKILWLGRVTERIQTSQLENLTTPIKIFRQMGGILALAEFQVTHLRLFQRMIWYRYLNIFKEQEEAMRFLADRRSGRQG